MNVLDRILTILTPYECLGCTAEGALLCAACIQGLSSSPERCYRCQRPSVAALTCSGCAAGSRLYRVRAAAPYTGLPKELVARLKFSGAQAAARQMASLLAPFTADGCHIVPVPTATSRVRSRGYDQARLLARELSRQTRLPYLECLVRTGQTHQVGASRQQRQNQLQRAFRLAAPGKLKDRHILLIDDVVTTGATLEAAARILHEAGARRVEGIVFCAA